MEEVHVYERDESRGGLVFVRAAPDDFFSHDLHPESHWTHHGTHDEFAEMVQNELGEWDGDYFVFEDGLTTFTHIE